MDTTGVDGADTDGADTEVAVVLMTEDAAVTAVLASAGNAPLF